MELKKCARCGCFFASSNEVCQNCEPKDKQDVYTLNNFIVNSQNNVSIDNLAASTGVSAKNITRFMENNVISGF